MLRRAETSVVEITKTCDCCPAQWEGSTADGRHVYVRFRYGSLQVGFGTTLHQAVLHREEVYREADRWNGCLEYEDLRRLVPQVNWP